MTAGIEWDESTVDYTDPRNSCARMEASQDWVQFVLDQPMAAEPGRTFVYSSGVSELLAQILKKATGEHVDRYAEKHLFAPLGITDYYWKKTPTGHHLTPESLARIGYLYLHDGVWKGQRVLPEGWVHDSTAPLLKASGSGETESHYGFQWWVLPWSQGGEKRWAAACSGYGGQILLVVPEHALLAVFTGWNIYERPSLAPTLALQRVVAALAEP
jgi:CubicO group peptidase (beta-lactamase class C family)